MKKEKKSDSLNGYRQITTVRRTREAPYDRPQVYHPPTTGPPSCCGLSSYHSLETNIAGLYTFRESLCTQDALMIDVVECHTVNSRYKKAHRVKTGIHVCPFLFFLRTQGSLPSACLSAIHLSTPCCHCHPGHAILIHHTLTLRMRNIPERDL